MSANHHTDVSAGASATAATVNAPLGQLDAKLTHTGYAWADNTDISTTVTTSGTYYAVTGAEVSFTPAYTGQTFLVVCGVGRAYAGTAGWSGYNWRITDGANATVVDTFAWGQGTGATGSANAVEVSGSGLFTAGAGDVGVTRKVKLYVTHSVNGSAVHTFYGRISVLTH